MTPLCAGIHLQVFSQCQIRITSDKMYAITFLSALQISFTEISHIQTVKEIAHTHKSTIIRKEKKMGLQRKVYFIPEISCVLNIMLFFISVSCVAVTFFH